jgi:hypothetical protein
LPYPILLHDAGHHEEALREYGEVVELLEDPVKRSPEELDRWKELGGNERVSGTHRGAK